MPLTGHLGELRIRLLRSLIAVAIAMAGTYGFSNVLIDAMAGSAQADLVFLSPTEAFWTTLKVSFFSGLAVALPFILFEVWRFISPGLLPKERRHALPFVVLGVIFFAAGVGFCYFVALPFALNFLVSFGVDQGLKPLFSVGLYIDFYLKFLLAFGIIFELPIAIVLLAKLGLVTPEGLSKFRRYAVLGNAVFAAILTPTADLFNMMLMMIPLMLFYEMGILGARLFGRSRKQPVDEEAEGRA